MSTNAMAYPCNRGVPSGPRDYHHFEFSNGVILCRYCGTTPPKGFSTVVRPSTTSPIQPGHSIQAMPDPYGGAS